MSSLACHVCEFCGVSYDPLQRYCDSCGAPLKRYDRASYVDKPRLASTRRNVVEFFGSKEARLEEIKADLKAFHGIGVEDPQ